MNKSDFAAEFERRTGQHILAVWCDSDTMNMRIDPYQNFETISTKRIAFARLTRALYSRAHLEAVVEAVGEKGAEEETNAR